MLVNFSWIREAQVAGMGLPSPSTYEKLLGEGIRAILTLTERPPPGDPEAVGLAYLHVPLMDFGTPSMEALTECVRWMTAQVDADRPVAVHCFAGQGRTGTVLAAWLVSQGMQAAEAIDEVRRLRPHSIETRGQVQAIHEFATQLAD